jgi:hypothetical protein
MRTCSQAHRWAALVIAALRAPDILDLAQIDQLQRSTTRTAARRSCSFLQQLLSALRGLHAPASFIDNERTRCDRLPPTKVLTAAAAQRSQLRA